MLTKKLADATEIREKMEIQMSDLRKQLSTVRDENKSLNSRVNALEAELRRTSQSSRKGSVEQSARENATENLLAERDGLKRDLEAAERLVRQSNENAKNKDAQLKRAVETIARLKSQLEDAQSTVQVRILSVHRDCTKCSYHFCCYSDGSKCRHGEVHGDGGAYPHVGKAARGSCGGLPQADEAD